MQGFFTHIVRYSSSVILSVCFGVHCPTFENTFIEEFYNSQRHWDNLLRPGNSPPVDVFPILKYVPRRWAAWKDECDLVGRGQRKLWQGLMKECVDRMNSGRRNDSFMEFIVDRKDKYGLNDEEIGYDHVPRTTLVCWMLTVLLLDGSGSHWSKPAQTQLPFTSNSSFS